MISQVLFIIVFGALFFFVRELRQQIHWQRDREREPWLLMWAGLLIGSITILHLALNAFNPFGALVLEVVRGIGGPAVGLALAIVLPMIGLFLAFEAKLPWPTKLYFRFQWRTLRLPPLKYLGRLRRRWL